MTHCTRFQATTRRQFNVGQIVPVLTQQGIVDAVIIARRYIADGFRQYQLAPMETIGHDNSTA
jgi:hypothetical protein